VNSKIKQQHIVRGTKEHEQAVVIAIVVVTVVTVVTVVASASAVAVVVAGLLCFCCGLVLCAFDFNWLEFE
jgi:1,4-dihydroxy-2-naphthoate octaprenyltransferase